MLIFNPKHSTRPQTNPPASRTPHSQIHDTKEEQSKIEYESLHISRRLILFILNVKLRTEGSWSLSPLWAPRVGELSDLKCSGCTNIKNSPRICLQDPSANNYRPPFIIYAGQTDNVSKTGIPSLSESDAKNNMETKDPHVVRRNWQILGAMVDRYIGIYIIWNLAI